MTSVPALCKDEMEQDRNFCAQLVGTSACEVSKARGPWGAGESVIQGEGMGVRPRRKFRGQSPFSEPRSPKLKVPFNSHLNIWRCKGRE